MQNDKKGKPLLSKEFVCLSAVALAKVGTKWKRTSLERKKKRIKNKEVHSSDEFPIVDLHTVTPQFIVDNALPLRTIAEAVENHLLDSVQRYEELDHWIV